MLSLHPERSALRCNHLLPSTGGWGRTVGEKCELIRIYVCYAILTVIPLTLLLCIVARISYWLTMFRPEKGGCETSRFVSADVKLKGEIDPSSGSQSRALSV